jgi:integrase
MARSTTTTQKPSRGRRGDGSISERAKADGTVVHDVYWQFPDPITGAMRRTSKRGFATRRDAARYLKTQTAAVDSGGYVSPNRQRLDAYLEQWLAGLRVSRQTLAGYRAYARRHINPYLGSVRLSELTAAQLTTLYTELELTGSHRDCCRKAGGCGRRAGTRPLSRSTVRQVHNVLSGALREAVEAGLLLVFPATRAKPPTLGQAKAQRQPFTVWTAGELSRFLEHWRDHRFIALWHLLATTGLRRGEALGLRWRDLDLDRGTASVQQTVGTDRNGEGVKQVFIQPRVKSGRPHMIALDTGTVAVLRAHRARQNRDRLALGKRWTDHDLVFCRDGSWLRDDAVAGLPLAGERVSALWRELVERTPGVSRIRLHDLRHTWATLALVAGVHPKVVQERLNHAHISITLELYSHTTGGMDREAAELVASLFSSSGAVS